MESSSCWCAFCIWNEVARSTCGSAMHRKVLPVKGQDGSPEDLAHANLGGLNSAKASQKPTIPNTFNTDYSSSSAAAKDESESRAQVHC